MKNVHLLLVFWIIIQNVDCYNLNVSKWFLNWKKSVLVNWALWRRINICLEIKCLVSSAQGSLNPTYEFLHFFVVDFLTELNEKKRKKRKTPDTNICRPKRACKTPVNCSHQFNNLLYSCLHDDVRFATILQQKY